MSWREQAACIDHKDVMWPNGNAPSSFAEVQAAKAVCAECPVTAECLADALSLSPRPHGVWGGTTAKDRKSMPVNRRRVCERCRSEFSGQASAKFCSHACQQASWVQRNRRSA